MLLTDLRELKRTLEIHPDNKAEDAKLLFFVEQATAWIEEVLGRVGRLSLKSRTEYYSGTGTKNLPLRCRPVYSTPTIAVRVDDQGHWGSTSGSFDSTTALTYGDDFALKIDQDDGTSRSGILVHLNSTWSRPFYREKGRLSPFLGPAMGNIRVVYFGGYTLDTLPAPFRLATNLLVARMRAIFPAGVEFSSEGYEERSVSINLSKDRLLDLVRPLLHGYRNWKW